MEQQKTTALAKIGGRQLEQYGTQCQELIQLNPRWMVLVEDGQFEQEKAELSLKIKDEDLAVMKYKTMKDIFSFDTPTLATVKKYQGELVLNATLHELIYWVRDSNQTRYGINDEQTETLCDRIFFEFYYFTLADIKHAFENGVMGQYGQIYNRITIDTFCDWLRKHAENRLEVASKLTVEDHKSKAATRGAPSYLLDIDEKKKEHDPAKLIFKHRIEKITESLSKHVVEKKHKTVFRFQTIEAYCQYHEIHDVEKFGKDLIESWKTEYHKRVENELISFDLYCQFMLSEFLVLANKALEND